MHKRKGLEEVIGYCPLSVNVVAFGVWKVVFGTGLFHLG
jgi:hypothetical protein